MKTFLALAALLLSPVAVAAHAEQTYTTWDYTSLEDKMRGVTTRMAFLDSIDGSSRLTVTTEGEDTVILFTGLTNMPMCTDPEFDAFSVKLDDGLIERIGCQELDGGDPHIVVFKDAKSVFTKLLASKHAFIEIDVYGAGREQVEFNTAGLDASKF